MALLPFEVLQYVCELTAEPVQKDQRYEQLCDFGSTDSALVHFLPLLGFSLASRRFRHASIPFLFRRIRVRTVEQAALVVASPLLQFIRHIHFPTIDALTCRRPVAAPVLKLVAQATSLRIAAANSTFFLTARTPLSCLLRSAKTLTSLDLHCEPISRDVNTLTLIADLVPACPRSLKALYITMPGGQPESSGVEALLNALRLPHPEDQVLPELEILGLSVHLAPLFTSQPEQLALRIAHRLASLRRVTLVAPGRNPRRCTSLLELVGSREESETIARGGFKQSVMSWELQRNSDRLCIDAPDEISLRDLRRS
ncbi:hypothetical protein CTheo_5294 [Ceratobasidium theobromae]|uniref:F-box-like domain containing protein n=1 Tax=Ceratobasidium theobromae TaxID=1582974 RepID=A0A5N5QHM8_9AGAM|nr:hypothetical protein CTheo_5294 [Ceratobasidium theobromae]